MHVIANLPKKHRCFGIALMILSLSFSMSIAAPRNGKIAQTTKLREYPGKKAHAMCLMKRGSRVLILNDNGIWYQVVYPQKRFGYKGYVFGDHVKLLDGALEQVDFLEGRSQEDLPTAKTKVRLNLRSSPGRQGKVLKTLKKGESVYIFSEKGKWRQVIYDRQVFGYKGWVSSRYLDTGAVPSVTDYPAEEAEPKLVAESTEITPDPDVPQESPEESQAEVKVPEADTGTAKPAVIASNRASESVSSSLIPPPPITEQRQEAQKLQPVGLKKNTPTPLESTVREVEALAVSPAEEVTPIPSRMSLPPPQKDGRLTIVITLLCVLLILSVISIFISIKLSQKSDSPLNLVEKLKKMEKTLGTIKKEIQVLKHPQREEMIEVDFAIDGRAHKGFIHNISEGGAFIETSQGGEYGNKVTLAFRKPGNVRHTKKKGRIVRLDKKGFGVQFDPPTIV